MPQETTVARSYDHVEPILNKVRRFDYCEARNYQIHFSELQFFFLQNSLASIHVLYVFKPSEHYNHCVRISISVHLDVLLQLVQLWSEGAYITVGNAISAAVGY